MPVLSLDGGGLSLPWPWARSPLWALNLHGRKNFLVLKMYLLIILFCAILMLWRCCRCGKYMVSKLRGIECVLLEEKIQFTASLAGEIHNASQKCKLFQVLHKLFYQSLCGYFYFKDIENEIRFRLIIERLFNFWHMTLFLHFVL